MGSRACAVAELFVCPVVVVPAGFVDIDGFDPSVVVGSRVGVGV